MGSAKTISIIVAANIKGLEQGLGKANKSLAKFASGAARMGSMLSFGVTAPLMALGKSAFDTFSKFENGMMKVKTVTGASVGEFKMLTEEAKRLGATTQFTALQVADLQLVLGRKGFDPTAIKNMEKSILDLALATGEDLSLAAEVTAASINAFKLESSDAASVANTLASAAANSSIQLSTFSTAFGHAGSAAKAVGVDLEELAAMMGVLMDNGIKASKAGTGLRKAFSKLNEEGVPFTKTLDRISRGTMTWDEALALVGETGANQLFILAGQIDKVRELTNEYKTNTTRLNEMAIAMGDTTHAKVKKMESAIESMKIEMGAIIAEAIQPMILKVTEWASAFQNLSEDTKKLILNIAAIAAVVGPLLLIISLLTSLAAVIATPVTLAIAGVAAAIYLIINIIDRLIRIFSGIGQAIGDNIEAIAERFSNFASRVKNFFIKAFTDAVSFIDRLAQKVGIDWFETDGEPVFDEIIPDDQLKKFVSWSDSVEKSEKRIDGLTDSLKEWIKAKLGMNTASGTSGGTDEGVVDADPTNYDVDNRGILDEYFENKEYEIKITPKIAFKNFMDDLSFSLGNAAKSVAKFMETWGDGIQQVGAIFSQNIQNQSIELDNEAALEEERIKKSGMSEEQKETALQALHDKTAKKQLELKRKQAKADKAMSIFNLIAATAEAVMKAAPDPFAMIAMGALGAAQMAMVASQPLPAFAEGGLVTGATMGLVGEGRGTTMSNPEVIAPLDKLKGMLGDSGGGGTVIPDVRISGDDLLIVFDRANRRKERR